MPARHHALEPFDGKIDPTLLYWREQVAYLSNDDMAHGGSWQRLLQGVREILQYQHRHRTRVDELMFQLAWGVERVDVNHYQPSAQRAEQRHRVLQQIGQHDGDALTLSQADLMLQKSAEIARQAIQFVKTDADVHIGKGGQIAVATATLFQHVFERGKTVNVGLGWNARRVVFEPNRFHGSSDGWSWATVDDINVSGTSINIFFGRITALRGTRNLAVYRMLSRLLCSVRLVLHPKLCIL